MTKTIKKVQNRTRRHARIRSRVSGTATIPRLAVFRSNRFVYAQLIDDDAGKTLAAFDSRSVKGENSTEKAKVAGGEVAKAAKKAGIEKVVFDRGGFKYQGAISALADGAREEGLKF